MRARLLPKTQKRDLEGDARDAWDELARAGQAFQARCPRRDAPEEAAADARVLGIELDQP